MSPPNSRAVIFGKFSSLWLSWDIVDRLFAYTLDNASSNNKFVDLLKSLLSYRKAFNANVDFYTCK